MGRVRSRSRCSPRSSSSASAGSGRLARDAVDSEHSIWPPLAAAINRAAREDVIDEKHRDAILARLEGDFASFTVVEIRPATLRIVPGLVVQHALRGDDAVQLAAALAIRREGGAVAFWSTDGDLITAARAEGLQGVVPA